jgi:hypothetical protein
MQKYHATAHAIDVSVFHPKDADPSSIPFGAGGAGRSD